ncbi:hypothetical protein DSO57_1005313 [Entomophthora muscae]|uniref:Uncharacterized protein n=1 Tax=Entomophthora muscae TaxID=34485 RepID=A0ACC2UHM3_9FUNG|nr:hypothetical protein DSO57_1005313 [Entomophthora muscae]
MSSLLLFERAKFRVLCVEAAATRKEFLTSSLEEAWASPEVSKIAPEESLVEVKAAVEELYSDYFAREETPAQGNWVYAWNSWNLLLGFNEILQQVKDRVNCEVEVLRNREEKSAKIMACWRDDNKVLSHKIASLETWIHHTKGVIHQIETGDAPPFQAKPYRKSRVEDARVSKELKQLLDAGLNALSQSPWVSPCSS